MKRALDVAVSLVGLVLTSPIIGLSALAVWLQDLRNPIYVSLRVRNQRTTFRMYKFRSMVPNADRMGGTSTSADDRRLTPAGRVIRLFKIDELPQLWNVLIGDMSLVGPRPQVVQDAIKYSSEENHLFDVRPGITDFASITFADEADILEGADDPDARYDEIIRPWKSRLGLFYVRSHSVRIDLQIVFLTVAAIVSRQFALRQLQALLRALGAEDALITVAGRAQALSSVPPPGSGPATDNGPYLPESVFARASWLQTLNRVRRVPVAVLQMTLMVASNYAAWFLRYDGVLGSDRLSIMWPAMAWLVAIRTITFIPFRLYEGLWLYTGIYDLKALFVGVLVSSVLFWAWVKIALPPGTYPYSVAIIDSMALFILLGGMRMARRLLAEVSPAGGVGQTVLIYGAGRAGEMAVREMKNQRPVMLRPIGFIDDNIHKLGLRIHGVPVLGRRRDLANVLSSLKPQELLLALPMLGSSERDELYKLAASFGVTVRGSVVSEGPVQTAPLIERIAAVHAEKCPKCHKVSVHRSKARTFLERFRRSTSNKRLFKCTQCGWRGWLLPTAVIGALIDHHDEVIDLAEIDQLLPVLDPSNSSGPLEVDDSKTSTSRRD